MESPESSKHKCTTAIIEIVLLCDKQFLFAKFENKFACKEFEVYLIALSKFYSNLNLTGTTNKYSRSSVARTLMARLLRLFRTRS